MKRALAWGDYALRVGACVLLFATGYGLLSTSTFALRMRNDAPITVLCLALSAALAFAPLLFGRHFLRAFLVSGFVLSGIGAYWWTTIPWDELVTDSGFPTSAAPSLLDFALVASPVFLATFYVALSRASVQLADWKNRGVERDEASRAAAASFLVGAMALVASTALSAILWAALASGWLNVAHPIVGVPAIVTACAVVAAAWIIAGLRFGKSNADPLVAAKARAAKARV